MTRPYHNFIVGFAGLILLTSFLGGCRSIQTSARIGSLSGVRKSVEAGVDVNSRTFEFHISALHEASAHGHTKIVEYLISEGADVNITTEGGETPLHYAARNGHIKVMQILLDNGADLKLHGTGCGTPLQWAARTDQLRAAELLLANGADVDNKDGGPLYGPLFDAIGNNNQEMFELLLRHGADSSEGVGGIIAEDS